MIDKVSTEVIELTDNSEFPNDSQKSRKSLEKSGEKGTDEKNTQDADSKFQQHSQNLQTELAVKTFEIKFEEKPREKRTLLSDSESREESQKSWTNPCVEITEHESLKEIRLPLKVKQL